MKNCIFCKHFNVSFEADWSDVTPGAGFTAKCLEEHWYIDGQMSTEDEWRLRTSMAVGCEDWEPCEED